MGLEAVAKGTPERVFRTEDSAVARKERLVMAIEWSDNIVVADLSDEPMLSEDLAEIMGRLEQAPAGETPHVVLNCTGVSYVGSSNIGQLLSLRKLLDARGRSLKLCCVSEEVRSIFSVTGILKLVKFAPDPMTALAGIQLEDAKQG
jgi:anti-anti-sigma factor